MKTLLKLILWVIAVLGTMYWFSNAYSEPVCFTMGENSNEPWRHVCGLYRDWMFHVNWHKEEAKEVITFAKLPHTTVYITETITKSSEQVCRVKKREFDAQLNALKQQLVDSIYWAETCESVDLFIERMKQFTRDIESLKYIQTIHDEDSNVEREEEVKYYEHAMISPVHERKTVVTKYVMKERIEYVTRLPQTWASLR